MAVPGIAELGVPVLGVVVLETGNNPFSKACAISQHPAKLYLGGTVGTGLSRGQVGTLVGESEGVGAGVSRGQVGTCVGSREGTGVGTSVVTKAVGAEVRSGQVGNDVRMGRVGGPVGAIERMGSVGAIEGNGLGVRVVGARLG